MSIAIAVAAFKALVVLSVIILIIGLIKPKWVLFWMKEPNRILVSSIALILFMVSFTGYSSLTVHPKPKSERDRTREEMNDLNLGRSARP